ncbi:RHS repeat domain-containing protein [Pseudomonas rustica]|uniref:RHS repeat domain-containing protein n=1 Tax=Pseudomonas rustica TaxID=2827099 RepID=UPI003CF1F362
MKATQHSPHPTLSVVDPRALAIRSVAYCQHPDKPDVEPRITRQMFDEAGREVAAWDSRLWGVAPKPNLSTVYALSGQVLLTDSVDAGWQLSLLEQAGSTLSFWDARGTQRHYEYDTQRRSVSVTEQMVSHPAKIVERLIYGDADEALAQHNQCGRLIRHDHPAGSRKCPSYGIAGSILTVQERFLEDLDTPDWPVDLPGRDALLEEQTFTTRSEFNPAGQLLKQIDARDNVQRFGYDLAGRSRDVWLQMAGETKPPRKLVSDIRYNAQDQVEIETAGNGVIARAGYDARDGRLTRLTAAIHLHKPLLDLHYCVDPVGNIVELEDKSQPVTYFNNQRIAPVCSYRYDSLYQLIEAKGWEVSQPSHGPALPELISTPLDPAQRRNYLQKFVYDSGGNLVSRQHSATAGFAMFTSGNSNRSLGQRDDGSLPGEPEISAGFDACGNQLNLNCGQNMVWDARNQLQEVTLVARENQPDDFECYRYDRPGHRVRKVSIARAAGQPLRSEVRYLPGLELRCHNSGEEHHVITVPAGRNSVQVLHWPDGAYSNQLRYGLSDHLGSSTLELNDEGAVLTREHYYPFGGTACWAGKNASVAKYKTYRYCGKERDATGFYYYGYRYYAPWLQRWVSADPAGSADDLNQYQMVGNCPLNFYDWQGLIKIPVDIFISDIVNPIAKDIGTGWFEELIWDEKKAAFASTGLVYGQGMKVYEGELSEWTPSSFGQAIAMFRDQDKKLRLFANMHFQHMGIQPGMGLPEFAGLMKSEDAQGNRFLINNHSGHYKPEPSIAVEAMIREIAPQQQSVRYVPVPESTSFDSAIRMESISSPEHYGQLVKQYKSDFKGLIEHLKEHGAWEAAKERWESSEGINVIFKMDASGMTAQQIYAKESEARYARVVAPPPKRTLATRQPASPPKGQGNKPSFFRSLFSRHSRT